jgi:nitrile hydratase subunit beta
MSPEPSSAYALGARVRIVDLKKAGHVRTPNYVREKIGTIDYFCGAFENPEERAYGRVGSGRIPLYRVRVMQRDLWPDYGGADNDSLLIEIYHHWLQPA